MNLTALIQEGESETLEFKEQWNEHGLEALASFVNTKGGTLLIGVKDNGTVIGWNGNDREQQLIINQIVEILGVHPAVSVQQEQGKAGPRYRSETQLNSRFLPGPVLSSRRQLDPGDPGGSTWPLFCRKTWCAMGQRY